MAIVEIVVAPLGTGSPSVSSYVAECHRVLEASEGIKFELHAMGTVIEGELDRLFEVMRALHEVPFYKGAQRVMSVIRIDDRRDKECTIAGKVKSVKEKLEK